MVTRAGGGMRIAGLLAVAVLLSGCWLQVGRGPSHQWSNPFETTLTDDSLTTVRQEWFTDLGATELSPPVVVGSRLYVTYLTGTDPQQAHVAALEASTGAVVWSHDLGAEVPAAVLGTAVFVGGDLWAQWFGADPVNLTCTGGVERIDADTGAVLGTELPNGQSSTAVDFGGSVASTRTTFDPVDCVAVDGPWLTVQDVATGAVEWRASGGVDSADLPYVVDDKIVVGGTTAYTADGCGAPTCAPVWSASVPDGIEIFGASTSGVFGATGAKRLVALDLDDGSQEWQAPLPGFGEAIAIAGNRVYVATGPDSGGIHRLWAFSADGCGAPTCGPLWSAAPGLNAGQPVVAGGVVYVPAGSTATGFDRVLAFDADGCGVSQCAPLHTINTPVKELVVAEGQLFGLSAGGLRAFAPDPTQDAVTGDGTIEFMVDGQPSSIVTPFAFKAESGPNGENPSGQVSLTELFAEAPVACLDVRTIPMSTPFEQATMNLATSDHGLVTLQVSDGNPEGIPDTISARTFSERSPSDCSPLSFGSENLRGFVVSGDVNFVNINPGE